MSPHERVYRTLLLAYPKRHREEYGEPMVQMMRDRLRSEGGGARSMVLWLGLLVDLGKTAFMERTEIAMDSLKAGWWRFGAGAIAIVLAVVGFDGLFAPASGPWYQWFLGRSALAVAPLVILAGMIVRVRQPRNGSILIALGVLPGAAAIVLFWWPPFLLFGLFSMTVLCFAIDDADRHHRAAKTWPRTGIRT